MQSFDTLYSRYSRTTLFTLTATLTWFAVTLYGEFFNGALNSACYPYLGCDAGFFGYDALEHFLFGFSAVWIIIFLCKKFPAHSVLNVTFWKSAAILIALVTLTAVIWEIGEFLRDAYLLNIAHASLLNIRLHINYLAQPSNFDTMGDLTFSIMGSLLAMVPFRRLHLNTKSP